MSTIHPCLWFDGQAEAAMRHYLSIFKNSKEITVARNPMDSSVLVCDFQLDNLRVTALNGGPDFKFNEANSLFITCKDQAEVDHYWNSLIADGGEPGQCGWLKDKFGLSWQVVPQRLMDLMSDPDAAKAGRVAQAMMKMRKIVIADLEAAAAA